MNLNELAELPHELVVARLQSEVDMRIAAHYLQVNREGICTSPPKSNDELHEFIQAFFGVKLPRKRVTPHHKTQFDFVADLFFERTKNALAFANRTGGKTLASAILNMLDALFKHECEIAHAGATLSQAARCYGYFTDFMKLKTFQAHCDRFALSTGKTFVLKSTQGETLFANDAKFEILTGTEKGLRSPHPNKARIDEIDEIEWKVFQTGLSMAMSKKRRDGSMLLGQNVFTSTRQHQDGSMQRLLNEAEQKGIVVYEWNIWESVEECQRRCVDDPKHGSCPIYIFCKGRAHHGGGFYAIDDFIEKVRLIDREGFETEWENKKPSRHKLVYPMFEANRHVMTPEKLAQLAGVRFPMPDWYRIGAIDFGSSPGHPFVFLLLVQTPGGQWILFHEYAAEQRLLKDHARNIKQSPLYYPGMQIFSDHDAQDRLELQAEGIRTFPADKDVNMGIEHVQQLLRGFPPEEKPVLYIWHGAQYTITEFGKYQWPVTPDGRIVKDKPMKENDHAMDALRYALFTYKHRKGRGYRTRMVSGV